PAHEEFLQMNFTEAESRQVETRPQDEVLSQMTSIWEDVLGVKPVRPEDNFFDLGGDSILAVQLFAKVNHVWGKSLSLAYIFDAPTPEKMAALVGGKNLPQSSPRVAAIK